LAFDLYLFNTWDGNDPTYGLDFFSLSGDVLFSETFTNHQEEGQTYAGKPDETLGPAGMRQTQVYRGLDPMGSGDQFLIAHSADAFTVTFGGPTTQSDEQWGIDNIRVSIDSLASASADGPSVAEPTTLALLGLALVGLGLWRKAPSWRRALARAVRGYRP
jgi:hypothetical protein